MRKILLPLLALLVGVALGFATLLTPAPEAADAEGFSANRAMADIAAIAARPHPVWNQQSLDLTRTWLMRRLGELGLEPKMTQYPAITDAMGKSYPLVNISARIPGKSGQSILLVSHYDSVYLKKGDTGSGSRGAADDGYGVATMLEIAGRLLKSGSPLENGVDFLFTDAEETGLNGARAEMESNLAAWRDVNFVVNIEARGVRGPAVMFETGPANRRSIELFLHAKRPFAYSFAVDVYRQMPNGTDFTEFLKQGYPGLNFAVLDDLSYYHTSRDNADNVSLSSVQHYGDQIYSLVKAYVRGAEWAKPEAFAMSEDMTYFNFLPGLFVSYPAGIAGFLSLVLAVLFLAWFALETSKKRIRVGSALRWFLTWLGLSVLALGVGFGVSVGSAFIAGHEWKLTYLPGIPGNKYIPWIFAGLELAVAWFLAGRARKKGSWRSAFAGASALNLLLLAAFHAYLPGGSFLLAVPTALSLLAVVLSDLTGWKPLALLAPLLTVALFLPIIHLLDLALTLGALGILLFLAAPALVLTGCMMATQEKRSEKQRA